MTSAQQKVRWGIVAAAIIILLSLYWAWLRSQRYTLLNGANGMAYRIDRATGETVAIRGTESWLVPTPQDESDLANAPETVVSDIHGRGGLSEYNKGIFFANLHNASSWTLRQVRFMLFREVNGQTAWSRVYSVPCYLKPESTEKFEFETVDAHLREGEFGWRVIDAKGTP